MEASSVRLLIEMIIHYYYQVSIDWFKLIQLYGEASKIMVSLSVPLLSFPFFSVHKGYPRGVSKTYIRVLDLPCLQNHHRQQ